MTPEEARSLLGVTPGATAEEIKHAVRKLSVRYHPDRHVGANAELVQLAQREFSRVQEAGRTLIHLLQDTHATDSAAEYTELERAVALLEQGDAAAAYEISGRILSGHPNHEGALTVRVRAAWAVEDRETALVCSRRLVETNPANWWNWFAVGESVYEHERFAENIAAFQRALDLAPADANVRSTILSELFHVQLLSGDHEGAKATLSHIALISRESSQLEFLREFLRNSQAESVDLVDDIRDRHRTDAPSPAQASASSSGSVRWNDSPAYRADNASKQAAEVHCVKCGTWLPYPWATCLNCERQASVRTQSLNGNCPVCGFEYGEGATRCWHCERVASASVSRSDHSVWAMVWAAVGAAVVGVAAGFQVIYPVPWYVAFILGLMVFLVGYKFWKGVIDAGF